MVIHYQCVGVMDGCRVSSPLGFCVWANIVGCAAVPIRAVPRGGMQCDIPLHPFRCTPEDGKGGGYPTPDFRAGLDWWLCQGWRGLIARCRSHIQLGQLYAIPPSQASVPHAYTCRLRVRRAEAAHQRGVVSQARELDSLECREPEPLDSLNRVSSIPPVLAQTVPA